MSGISIRNVRKSYGKTEIVHGVDLEIGTGEFVVILGPSGCGKSTLLRMVAGLESITSGEIALGDVVVNKLEPRERGCAMVFQNYALYPHMSVAENIGYSLKIAGMSKVRRDARIVAVANSLNIFEFLDRKPGQLSGGQRQRVAMGRAMIREPKIFLYDEPLSNLDAKLRVAMRVEIRRLQQRLGTTTLFVTHDQVEAMTLADRIVVMNKGTIEQVGTPREIYARPASVYVAGFVGNPGLNLIKGEIKRDKRRITLVDGQTLGFDTELWPTVPDGEIIVGFRAEAAQIRDKAKALKLSVHFSEDLGNSRLMHCALAGTDVVIAAKASSAFEPGKPIKVTLNPEDIHLFDATSGLRQN